MLIHPQSSIPSRFQESLLTNLLTLVIICIGRQFVVDVDAVVVILTPRASRTTKTKVSKAERHV